jgi:glycosyltransferase involved in cell wall biosynthesis
VRVLHIGKFFPPHPGGIERCLADLCAELNRNGVAVSAVAHAEPGQPSRTIHAEGFDVELAACRGQLLYAPLSPGFPRLLARTIAAFRPDLLHLHVPNTSALFALLLPAARRLPWVVHWHADIPPQSQRRMLRAAYAVYRPWERALLRRAAAIIATSAPYLESSQALAPWRGKTRVIPLGIGAAPAAPERGEHGRAAAPKLRVLSVGRLSYFKGIDVLLRALVDVPEASLEVVGDGECRAELERLAAALGIAARVRFAGRIDIDPAGAAALAAAYRDADVVCLPSTERAESFGLVLLEAMRARRAVVASKIPGSGVGFVVRDGETGLLVPPGDVGALAAALRRLAGDDALRDRLARAGEQRWHSEFTLERSARCVLDLYRTVLSPASRAAAAPGT